MTVQEILAAVEASLPNDHERAYFLTHSVRYRTILTNIRRYEVTNQGKPLKILDVGCFPYHIGKALELMGHEVYGIASSHEPIKNPRIKVLNIETDTFPWKDNFFDLVIFTEVLEHIPQSPLLALREMHRVARPGGHLLLTTPNIARSINRGKLAAGKSVMYPVSDLLDNNGKGSVIYMRHNREYTMDEVKEMVDRSSWIVEKAQYFVSYTPFRRRTVADSPLLWTGKFLNYLIMSAIPSLRDTLLVIGKK